MNTLRVQMVTDCGMVLITLNQTYEYSQLVFICLILQADHLSLVLEYSMYTIEDEEAAAAAEMDYYVSLEDYEDDPVMYMEIHGQPPVKPFWLT